MINTLKRLLGLGEKVNYSALVEKGAIIIDVRTKGEYSAGHIKSSVNIPVDILKDNLNFLKDKTKPVITCCASGMRSATAANILKSKGFTRVYNGGGWRSLQNKLQ